MSDEPALTVDLRTAVGRGDAPMLLAAAHRRLAVGEPLRVHVEGHDPELLIDLCVGAGFAEPVGAGSTVRLHSLPDTVGPSMRFLVCGLNPSPAASEAGVGFARPGNRFWPAALASGLATIDRDADHALVHHGVGMTDLAKRTTRTAAELTRGEYRDGVGRIGRLVERFAPDVLCFVGLAGWRAAVDRSAGPGFQEGSILGGRGGHVYLMPSTSGLNASSRLDDLTEHLRTAMTRLR